MKHLPVSTVFLLKRAELAVRSCVESVLMEFDLTPTQFMILLILEQSDGLSAAQLSRSVGVRPQSINDIVGPLERKGLIKRRESPEHRRILETRLSAAGERLLAKAAPVARALEQQLLEGFGAQELARLRDSLEKIRVQAETHETHPTARRTAAVQLRRAQVVRPVSKTVSAEPRRRR